MQKLSFAPQSERGSAMFERTLLNVCHQWPVMLTRHDDVIFYQVHTGKHGHAPMQVGAHREAWPCVHVSWSTQGSMAMCPCELEHTGKHGHASMQVGAQVVNPVNSQALYYQRLAQAHVRTL